MYKKSILFLYLINLPHNKPYITFVMLRKI